jgi:hypothetical protein
MSEDLKDPGVIQLLNDTTDESATLPIYVTLQDEHYYYWAVNCSDSGVIDPNTSEPIETLGDIWYFYTGDALPIVDAGPDEFAWVAKDDFPTDPDDDPESYYITVIGTYTDDGKSPIADANFVNLGWDIANGDAGIEKVSQTWEVDTDPNYPASGTVTAVYRTYGPTAAAAAEKPETAITGYWDLQLQVTDGSGTSNDVAYVRVDADCTDAAAADASDDFDTTFDAVGNRNCKNDLPDLAAFAEVWLDQSDKYE